MIRIKPLKEGFKYIDPRSKEKEIASLKLPKGTIKLQPMTEDLQRSIYEEMTYDGSTLLLTYKEYRALEKVSEYYTRSLGKPSKALHLGGQKYQYLVVVVDTSSDSQNLRMKYVPYPELGVLALVEIHKVDQSAVKYVWDNFPFGVLIRKTSTKTNFTLGEIE